MGLYPGIKKRKNERGRKDNPIMRICESVCVCVCVCRPGTDEDKVRVLYKKRSSERENEWTFGDVIQTARQKGGVIDE